MQTPGTKEHGSLFAELHAHFFCQNDVGRLGMGSDFDFRADL